jgi:hypothetical protein
MKKSTIFLLAAAVVLAVVAFIATRKGGPAAPKKLDIAGYASEAQLEAEKKLGLMDARPTIEHPIDEVVLERADSTIRLVRAGTGEEAKWRLAAPVEAPAVKYQVEQLLELFKTKTTRMDARAVKPGDLPLFDLEAERRIGLTLKSQGAVWNGVDLIVGQVVKDGEPGGEESVKGTWVLVKGDEATAFLIADKDLRTAASKTVADLRDKKVFDFEADAVSRIEVIDPSGAKVVVVGETVETPPAPDAGEDAKPTRSTTWTLSEPAGVKGDAAVSSLARSLANLRVNEFVPLSEASDEAKQALAGATWRIAAKLGESELKLIVSDAAKEPIWAQLEGKDELMTLASYAANNVRKGVDELKDKTIFDLNKDQVTALTLKGDAGPIALEKVGETWRFTAPAVKFAADPTSFLTSSAKLSAVRWAKPTELEAARAALAAPDIDAVIKVGEATHRIAISSVIADPAGGGAQNRWAVVGDVTGSEPFLVSDFVAKRFVTTVDTLRMKKLLPGGKDDIVALSIQLAGEPAVTLEKPSTGGGLTRVSPPAGKVSHDEAIRTLASTLGALDAKSFHDGKGAGVTGLAPDQATKVVIKRQDGSSATLWLSGTSAGDGQVYAQIDQGPLANTPVAVNEYQAKNIAKSLDELTKNAEIPSE